MKTSFETVDRDSQRLPFAGLYGNSKLDPIPDSEDNGLLTVDRTAAPSALWSRLPLLLVTCRTGEQDPEVVVPMEVPVEEEKEDEAGDAEAGGCEVGDSFSFFPMDPLPGVDVLLVALTVVAGDPVVAVAPDDATAVTADCDDL